MSRRLRISERIGNGGAALAAVILALLLSACGDRPYPSESGVIVYQHTGRSRFDETITWDHWGMRSVTVRNGTRILNGRRVPHVQRTVITPDVTYSYATGHDGYVRINVGSRRIFGRGERKNSDRVDAGEDTVAGVVCESRRDTRRGSEICMAGRLPLRVVTGSNITKVATSITLNADVDPAIFEPEGEMLMEMSAQGLTRAIFLGGVP